MADTKISALPAVSVVADANEFAVNEAGTSKKATAAQIKTYLQGTWTDYTPTWTGSVSNPVIGNGTLQGRFLIEGKRMHFSVYIQAGSTTTFGSGTYTIGNLPGTAKSSGMNQQTAPAHIQDAGTTNFHGLYRIAAGATGGVLSMADTANPRDVTNTSPMAWATSDFINITGTIEID